MSHLSSLWRKKLQNLLTRTPPISKTPYIKKNLITKLQKFHKILPISELKIKRLKIRFRMVKYL